MSPTAQEVEAEITLFVEKTKALDGKEVRERTQWNWDVTADAIRHFAFGIGDENPLWIDPEHAKKSRYGRLMAPPAYLCSVMYPILHGAPMLAPLSSLIGGVEYTFNQPVREGDRLLAMPKQKETYEKRSSSGRRLIFVISEITYTNQRNEVVGTATGTMIRATLSLRGPVPSELLHVCNRAA